MATKYCPECGGEYQDWVEKCLDCGVRLTDIKPEPGSEEALEPEVITVGDESYTSEPLIKIAEYDDSVNAQFNKDLLESEGIKSLIYDGNTVTDWIGIRPRMKISLIVRQVDAEKASEILNGMEGEDITIVPEIDDSVEDDKES
jgi:hypothetical protein